MLKRLSNEDLPTQSILSWRANLSSAARQPVPRVEPVMAERLSQHAVNPRAQLQRRLGPGDAAAIVIANVIGVGIFTTPGIVAAMVPHPIGLLTVWIAGGALAFAGAMAYAELAVRFPRAGGEYVYLKESYGPLMAFLTGWTSFAAGF